MTIAIPSGGAMSCYVGCSKRPHNRVLSASGRRISQLSLSRQRCIAAAITIDRSDATGVAFSEGGACGMTNSVRQLRRLLKQLQWAKDGLGRSDYEAYLREHSVLGEDEDLADRPDLAEVIYRDWQARPQVACVFAQRIAKQPGRYGVATVTIADDPWREMTKAIDATADAVVGARGTHEGLTVLLPRLNEPKLLVAYCKRLGARNSNWRIEDAFNPSDNRERVHVSLRFTLEEQVEAEILGFGPFRFLPLTRRSPITALEIRTKPEGAKERTGAQTERAHLAHIPWPDTTRDRYWSQSQQARRTVLGGDDSSARARITFAIPRWLWDGHDQ